MASKTARRKQQAVRAQMEGIHAQGKSGADGSGPLQEDEGQKRSGVTARKKRASRKLPAREKTARKKAVRKPRTR